MKTGENSSPDNTGNLDPSMQYQQTPVQLWQGNAGAATDQGGTDDSGQGGDDKGGTDDHSGDNKGGDDKGGDDRGQIIEWPTDWRERAAEKATGSKEGDAYGKELKRLQRFQDPGDIYKSNRELEKKLSSGNYRRVLSSDADEKELAAFRKEMGIPEKPEGYYDEFGELAITDEDKPIFDDMLESVAHKHNLSPSVAKDLITWTQDLRKTRDELRQEEDLKDARDTTDLLRTEWGPDYRANQNMISNLLARAPEDVRDKLKDARFPDGKALFNDPNWLKYLAGLEREINPASRFVPPSGGDGGDLKNIDARVAEIEKFMRTNRDEYNKDQAMQDELQELYEAQEKMQARQ